MTMSVRLVRAAVDGAAHHEAAAYCIASGVGPGQGALMVIPGDLSTHEEEMQGNQLERWKPYSLQVAHSHRALAWWFD